MRSIKVTKSYSYLIILFLGILTSFSLPPYNFFFLNFISLPTLLYILINHISGRFKYFLTGWLLVLAILFQIFIGLQIHLNLMKVLNF